MYLQIAIHDGQMGVIGVRSGYVAGLMAFVRVVEYDMILAAGSLPDIDVTQLRHTCEVWQAA